MKEKALKLFDQKYNCCQAVVCAYGENYGLSHELCFKIAATFGGGIGRSAKYLCGSINGALIILGLAFSDKEILRTKTKQLLSELEANHKSLKCIDLLCENNENNSMHSDKCRKLLDEACTILDRLLA